MSATASALIDNISIVNAAAAAALATANAELAAAQIAYDNALAEENVDLRTDGTPVDSIDFSKLIVATDTNGDSVTGALPGSFVIAVQDDVPVVNQVQVLSFDDIPARRRSTVTTRPMAKFKFLNGYGGFNWSAQGLIYKHFPGDDPGTPPFPLLWESHSGNNLAKPADNGGTITITPSDGAPFTFLGAWFSTPFAPVTLTVKAYGEDGPDAGGDPDLLATHAFPVNTGGPTFRRLLRHSRIQQRRQTGVEFAGAVLQL